MKRIQILVAQHRQLDPTMAVAWLKDSNVLGVDTASIGKGEAPLGDARSVLIRHSRSFWDPP